MIMPDVRYSVMVLPKRASSILLQSFTNDEGGIIWDGFGCFYKLGDNPLKVALQVFSNNFKSGLDSRSLHQTADLNYFINKPDGLVDLRISVYFADTDDELAVTGQMDWFDQDDVPYNHMHPATAKWLPIILVKPAELLTATVKAEQPGHHTTGKVTSFVVN
jgi:hypothetical protein